MPAAPGTVLGYLPAHPPAGPSAAMSGSTGRYGRTLTWGVGFDLPAVPGRLSQRALLFTLATGAATVRRLGAALGVRLDGR